MKWIIKLLSLILVVGVTGLFILKRPDGKPWLTLEEFGFDIALVGKTFQSLLSSLSQQSETALSGNDHQPKTIMVYKWRDVEGNWQYSDKPPTDRDELVVETLKINSNTNIVPARKTSELVEKKPSNSVELEQDKVPLPLSASPAQIKELVEETKKVQQLSNQRQELLDEY